MKQLTYQIVITPEPDGSAFNVAVPDIEGCFTFGSTVEEALAMAKEAIELNLESAIESGEPVPAPTSFAMHVTVDVPAKRAIPA